MRKCKAMDRQMAPTSHGFDEGGIFKRDWFSDRLESIWKRNNSYLTGRSHHNQTQILMEEEHVAVGFGLLFLPVQGIAHLYGNQDGQSHGHWIRRLKN